MTERLKTESVRVNPEADAIGPDRARDRGNKVGSPAARSNTDIAKPGHEELWSKDNGPGCKKPTINRLGSQRVHPETNDTGPNLAKLRMNGTKSE